MIIVTGTKRSGTSMWMQVLRAGGVEVIGSAFPKDWGDVLREANPEGFFESPLRSGIYFRTNPNPKTGAYLSPEDSRQLAVKVFVPGVIRSDLAFVDKVIASIRNWREYHGSLIRLYTMEYENRNELNEKQQPEPNYLSPTHEWWNENFNLLRDFIIRRYPIHMVAYETILREPKPIIEETLNWLGVGDPERAVAAVKPDLRTHEVGAIPEVPGVEPQVADVLDELYARIRDRRELDVPFIERLNGTDDILRPQIQEELRDLRQVRIKRWREAQQRKAAEKGEKGAEEDGAADAEPEAAESE